MRYHADERRAFWGDIFDTPDGDFNVVKLNPGVVIAWHRHQRQDDRIAVIDGDVYIQAIDPEGNRHHWHRGLYVGEFPIVIPRGWWHGYATDIGATLVQFNGPGKWDGSDEERASLDQIPWSAPTP